MSRNKNIIIDTDPGTDDALALGLASVFFKNNISALISTYGNVDGEQTYKNMVNLANLLEINCEFIQGSLSPLSNAEFTPTDYHGRNGLCGLELPGRVMREPVVNGDFMQNLFDIIKSHKNITYIAIGPLTNFAKLLEKFPDAVNYIGELIIMGGGFEVSNMAHNTEFNFSADSAAVKKVLECPVKKILAPLDMTHKLSLSLEEIKDITEDNNGVMSKLLYLNYETSVKHGNGGAIIHDAATIAYLLDENQCDIHEHKIISDEYGAVSKNLSGYPVNIIEKINRDYIKILFKRCFKEL